MWRNSCHPPDSRPPLASGYLLICIGTSCSPSSLITPTHPSSPYLNLIHPSLPLLTLPLPPPPFLSPLHPTSASSTLPRSPHSHSAIFTSPHSTSPYLRITLPPPPFFIPPHPSSPLLTFPHLSSPFSSTLHLSSPLLCHLHPYPSQRLSCTPPPSLFFSLSHSLVWVETMISSDSDNIVLTQGKHSRSATQPIKQTPAAAPNNSALLTYGRIDTQLGP